MGWNDDGLRELRARGFALIQHKRRKAVTDVPSSHPLSKRHRFSFLDRRGSGTASVAPLLSARPDSGALALPGHDADESPVLILALAPSRDLRDQWVAALQVCVCDPLSSCALPAYLSLTVRLLSSPCLLPTRILAVRRRTCPPAADTPPPPNPQTSPR